MGLISRVSSRTYRTYSEVPKKLPKMFVRRMLTSSAIRRSDPIQQLYVQKIKEYSKLAASGKIDQAAVNAEIDAAKARLGGSADMSAFPKLEFQDADHSAAVKFDF